MTHTVISPETSPEIIEQRFNALKENQFKVGNSTATERIKKLDRLQKAIMQHKVQIREALQKDFQKHPSETDLTEIYPVTGEIKHTRKHLYNWMGKHKVSTPLALFGASSYVKYEPKGAVLIISPWNFPLNLSFGPLVSAIAAGNTVMIKPSEYTPHTSALMKTMISEIFDENEVTVIEGGIKTSQKLLSLPFDHIFFTGSPGVGKIVMEAAAKHLTSVTLELGGKSPTIVDASANIDKAARRIAWSKYINNGQICIAPDYVLVDQSVSAKFIEKVKEHTAKYYGEDASSADSYCRVINRDNFDRVKELIDNAVNKGAEVITQSITKEDENYISPTVLANVPLDSAIMQEEIFGPVMPIVTYNNLSEAIDLINSKEKPLALYIFSKRKKNINYILSNTRAGGGCINHTAIHFYNNDLPFGGANNSGIGKGHGWFGFEAFSNPRGIMKQNLPSALELLTPPYNGFKQKIIDLVVKWL